MHYPDDLVVRLCVFLACKTEESNTECRSAVFTIPSLCVLFACKPEEPNTECRYYQYGATADLLSLSSK